jgi:glycosyltransferase involved in cell wall biosynthesis
VAADLVSAVIPTHNRVNTLGRAIESAFRQEGFTPEVVVVDDGSTDGTAELLRGYGERITVIRNECPVERGAARNMGVRKARNAVIAFLDSDDEWMPTKLVQQLGYVRPGIACVSSVDMVDGTGRVIRESVSPGDVSAAGLRRRNTISPSTLVLCRSDFEAAGGFPEAWSVQGSEDWLFFARLARHVRDIVVRPAALTRYRVHEENWGADPDRVALSMWSAVQLMEDEELPSMQEIQRVRAETAMVIARLMSNAGRLHDSVGWIVRGARWGSWHQVPTGSAMAAASWVRGAIRRRGAGVTSPRDARRAQA